MRMRVGAAGRVEKGSGMEWVVAVVLWILQALLLVGLGMTLLVLHWLLVHWVFQALCRWFRL